MCCTSGLVLCINFIMLLLVIVQAVFIHSLAIIFDIHCSERGVYSSGHLLSNAPVKI